VKLLDSLTDALNARKSRALRIAEAALPESQFRAFRSLFLDEFGRSGLEEDLARIVAEFERQGKASGRPIHAREEVRHA
jgi:hypothetical protein